MSDVAWWPPSSATSSPSGVTAVSVNYNTADLIALLIWSLHRILDTDLRSVVVVDNGSTDGSLELLHALADAGLCELVVNPTNRHHGPALTQAMSHLAGLASEAPERSWIWFLDSDCVIARADAAEKALATATASGAALVGEPHWDRWNEETRFFACSLLLDPARVWRAEIGAFEDGGDPVGEFGVWCRTQGVPAASFPFTREGHVVHLGRATLAGVRERGETTNPLFAWSRDHHEPHFQAVPGAEAKYAAIVGAFREEVPHLDAATLVRACMTA